MATITRFVDTASSGGDGTTQSHSGGTAAYASLNAWEAAEQTNLVTDGDTHVVNCAGGNDTTNVLLTGWTTGASNKITIQGDATAPDGDGLNTGDAFSSSFYVKQRTSAGDALEINEDFVDILDLQLEASSGSSTNVDVIEFSSVNGNAELNIERCRFKGGGTGTNIDAITLSDPSLGVTANIINCTFDWASTTSSEVIFCNGMPNINITNCTISNGSAGLRLSVNMTSGHTVNVLNCAIFNCADDVLDQGSATLNVDFCATDDGDGTNSIDISPGGTEADDWNNAFTDYVNGDFTVKDTSSVLYNAGTNTGAPSDDLLGTVRPQAVTTDVGAFELVAAAAAGSPPFLSLLGVGT